ncbi:hypothetical protein [Fictibacillus enclensis]|nr:hypothetical protein [Fictibacillus enclensis]
MSLTEKLNLFVASLGLIEVKGSAHAPRRLAFMPVKASNLKREINQTPK